MPTRQGEAADGCREELRPEEYNWTSKSDVKKNGEFRSQTR